MRELVLTGIEKRYPGGVVACSQVDLTIRAGEVVALLGENGAGKTTLMRIATGVTRADKGRIVLDGRPLSLTGPRDAILHGINMVHQHFMLIPRLSVAENVVLGFEGGGRLLDRRRIAKVVSDLASRTGLVVDVERPVEDLTVGEQQRVEILRALYQGAEILVLDEPTAVLTPDEVEGLFDVVRQLVRGGKAVVFISHKLHEVRAIADRIVVLRHGAVVGEREPGASSAELAALMIGSVLDPPSRGAPREPGPVALSLRAVSAAGTPGLAAIDMELRCGEIVGVAGVDGNGQSELEQVVAGTRPISSGAIDVQGSVVRDLTPGAARRLGIVRIPSDRHREGLVEGATIWENLALFDLSSFTSRGVLDVAAARRRAAQLVAEFDVRCRSIDQRAGELSGGNQQKLVIARELSVGPRVVVAAQPTRGLDVGAAAAVHKTLLSLREQGAAVLLVSADLDEVCELSDRVVVLYGGRVIGSCSPDDRDRIGQMMAGVAA